MTYQDDQLFAELAFLGTRLNWPLDDLLDLDHFVRRRFIAELAQNDE